MKSKYLLLFLVFIYQASASFATEKYKFRTMSPDGGFYYDGIKAIEQDIEGFIWVMMDYELYRLTAITIKSTILILPRLPQQKMDIQQYSIRRLRSSICKYKQRTIPL